jgi:hypothetical protein
MWPRQPLPPCDVWSTASRVDLPPRVTLWTLRSAGRIAEAGSRGRSEVPTVIPDRNQGTRQSYINRKPAR